jgi:peroxiredoxin
MALALRRKTMGVLRKGLVLVQRNKLMVVLFCVVAYLALQRLGYLLSAPAITPGEAQARKPFAVDFTLPDLQGNAVRLSDLRGQVVLLNFWATWCPPCRAEMPSMHALYQEYREKGLEILAISSDVRGKEIVAPFIARLGLTFPVLLDPRNVVGSQLWVQGLPTSYVLDKQGRVAGLEIGARDWNKAAIRRLLEQLLAEDAV